MTEKSSQLIDWLVHQKPPVVQNWLEKVWKGEETVPPDFDWPHFTAAVEVQARAGKGPNYYTEPDIEWARITLSLYRYLIEHSNDRTRSSLKINVMALKAHFILRFQPAAGDLLFDIDQIVAWFFASLPFSMEVAEEQCKHLGDLNSEELLQLRYIKDRLAIIKWLQEKDLLTPDNELDRWLTFREKLP